MADAAASCKEAPKRVAGYRYFDEGSQPKRPGESSQELGLHSSQHVGERDIRQGPEQWVRRQSLSRQPR